MNSLQAAVKLGSYLTKLAKQIDLARFRAAIHQTHSYDTAVFIGHNLIITWYLLTNS